jgi:peptide/nickel transport system substrate-binding protein
VGGRRVTLAMMVVTIAIAAACGGDGREEIERGNTGVVEEDGGARPGGRIVYGLEAETDGWNPSSSKWAPSGLQVARAVFDTLTAYDDQLEARPNLAESLTPSEDYTQWTIRLRPGVTLHNGKPVSAEVVRANFEFLKDSILTRDAFEPIESYETVGELDVIVNMKRPWVNYPYSLTTQIGVVADPDWLRETGRSDPIGTGPFAFKEWLPDNRLVVERNAGYWRVDEEGISLPYLDEVEFRPIPDVDARAASLRSGTLDAMMTSSSEQIRRFIELGTEGDYQVFNDVSGETAEAFIQLNTMAPPLDDPDARRALALATDTESYIDVFGQGLVEPARGPFPPASPWYVATDYPEYDPEAAEELVEEVRTRHGGEFSFSVLGPSEPSGLQALQFLQEQWRDVGIEATIEPTEQSTLITRVATGDYQATIWRQFDSPHPLGDSVWWHPNTAKPIGEIGLNFARNRNERIGEALDEARETPDRERERELYQEVQRELARDIPYIWLHHTQISVIATNNLVNVVNYTLPGGQKGIEIYGGSHPMFQVWRSDSAPPDMSG